MNAWQAALTAILPENYHHVFMQVIKFHEHNVLVVNHRLTAWQRLNLINLLV